MNPNDRPSSPHGLPHSPGQPGQATAPSFRSGVFHSQHIEIVCLGASTGGPNALVEVIVGLGQPLPVPLVMVQHMPPGFTEMLADRITNASGIPCYEAVHGQTVEPGSVYLAPGGCHMEVHRQVARAWIHLHDGPLENSCRPSVDVLFRSVAQAYGGSILGVILTGMGADGLLGCRLIHENGGQVVVQNEATSVVWGMPGMVAHAGIADAVLPLPQIAGEILRRVKPGARRP